MLTPCFDSQGALKDDVFDNLVKEYRAIIYNYANKYYLPGGEAEDLYQWGLIGLYKAVLEYREDKLYSFELIARVNIKNAMKVAVRMANRQKHLALNSSVSLYYVDEHLNLNASREYIDHLVVEDWSQNPLETAIAQETVNKIKKFINNCLSESERSVILLYIKGYKQRHIAQKLNFQPKFVDNALQRARKKIYHFIFL